MTAPLEIGRLAVSPTATVGSSMKPGGSEAMSRSSTRTSLSVSTVPADDGARGERHGRGADHAYRHVQMPGRRTGAAQFHQNSVAHVTAGATTGLTGRLQRCSCTCSLMGPATSAPDW